MMRLASPHYAQLAWRLREFIRDGRWQPGERLPAERCLCDQFGLSRITIRQALQLLEQECLVERRHGSGTYVRPHSARRIPLMIDYTGSIRLHAPRARRHVLLRRWQAADQEAAVGLAIAPGEQLLFAERLDVLQNNQPVAWDQVYIPAFFGKGLEQKHLARVDFIETWTEACQFKIESCHQKIEAVRASVEDCRNLGIRRGKPILKSTETYSVQKGDRAGLFVSHYHPEHISISSTFDWGSHQRSGNRRVK